MTRLENIVGARIARGFAKDLLLEAVHSELAVEKEWLKRRYPTISDDYALEVSKAAADLTTASRSPLWLYQFAKVKELQLEETDPHPFATEIARQMQPEIEELEKALIMTALSDTVKELGLLMHIASPKLDRQMQKDLAALMIELAKEEKD